MTLSPRTLHQQLIYLQIFDRRRRARDGQTDQRRRRLMPSGAQCS